MIGIFHLTSESVAGVVLLLWQTELYIVTGLGSQDMGRMCEDSRAGKQRNKGRQDQIARRRPEVSILYESNAPSENNTELWSQDLLSDF